MKTIYKYVIPNADKFDLELPMGAKILDVQTQNDVPHIWVLFDAHVTQKVTRTFRLAGAGHSIEEEDLGYIGTFQLRGGSLVFHLFEI